MPDRQRHSGGLRSCGGGACRPVDHHGQQDNDNAGGKSLAKPGGPLVCRHQNLASDVIESANDGGNDYHRQAGQNQLVDANEDLMLGAGKLDEPEPLPGSRPRHCRYFAEFLRNRFQPEKHIAGHRGGGIDHAGQNAGNRAKAEQNHQRCQIGKGRDGLHQIKGRLQHSVGAA